MLPAERFSIDTAVLVLPEGLQRGSLLIENGRIAAISPENGHFDAETGYDAGGRYVSPGFIDLHVHGGGGYDFMDGTVEAALGAARTHLAHGTTLLLPTTVACADEELERVFAALRAARTAPGPKPDLYGIHLEGPYLAPEQKGAIDPRYLKLPEPAHVERLLALGGADIKRITLACELPGALELCDRMGEAGVLLSIGHSDAEYAAVCAAVAHGCSLVTHLYRAMSTLRRRGAYRYLGLVESAYLIDALSVEIIADGKHLPPELLRLILKEKDNDAISLITDAMRGAGQPDGTIARLGSLARGQDAIVRDGVAFVMDGSCFAGSVCTADRCVRTIWRQTDVPLHRAVAMMTQNPARVLGLDGRKGALRPGFDADLCVFGEDVAIEDVFVAGCRVVGPGEPERRA